MVNVIKILKNCFALCKYTKLTLVSVVWYGMKGPVTTM